MIAAKGYRGGLLALLLMSGMIPSTAQDTNRFEQAYPQVATHQPADARSKQCKCSVRQRRPASFCFLSPECPLSQNYTLVLNNLEKKFGKELKSYGIIPGRAYSIQEVRQFAGELQTRNSCLD